MGEVGGIRRGDYLWSTYRAFSSHQRYIQYKTLYLPQGMSVYPPNT